MADDVKFNWDPNKHDEKLPTQIKTIKVACPHCNEGGAIAELKDIQAQIDLAAGKMMVNLTNSGFIICCKCSNVFHMQEVLNAVRAKLSKPPTQGPQEQTH